MSIKILAKVVDGGKAILIEKRYNYFEKKFDYFAVLIKDGKVKEVKLSWL